ncbi:MAG: hypothetical protein V7731_13400 [Amphritea sp.]
MTEDILNKAAEKGIIQPEQIAPLVDFIQQQQEIPDSEHGEEQLKFIRNFGDIFITLGIVFVAVSAAALSLPQLMWLIPAGLFILTSEWLVRVRRLALPGIALLISTLYFISRALGLDELDNATVSLLILSGCSLLFYVRYRMPFSLLPVAAGLVAAVISLIGVDMVNHQYLFSLLGLCVFSAAMAFDARDRERALRYSDCGFWLHLLASPLIVHGMMTTVLFTDSSVLTAGLTKELMLILFFILFFLVALFVDRRAMLVSSLSYAIYAIIQVTEDSVLAVDNLPLFIFMSFGIFIVFFGTYWYKARRLIFGKAENLEIAQYVPHF